MIAVDTSALIAILLGEARADACRDALVADPEPFISAVNLTEALIVARGKGVLAELVRLLEATPLGVIPSNDLTAARVSAIYSRWGKGNHPAKLNFCDCFAYDVAREFSCPLLFIGNDFSQTDIVPATGL